MANVFDEGYVQPKEFVSVAHAVNDALVMLDVEAHKPIQGEAMHKVIAYHVFKALEQVDIDHDGRAVFRIRDDL